jgi:DNA-binding transcriptional MerR regulator
MSEKLTYSIRDLEELSGIPAHTIRTWERRYGLFTPSRNAGNVRCYDVSDVAYLHQLVLLIKQGNRISVLARKSRGEIQALVNEAVPVSNAYDITEALCMALQDFDTSKVEGLMTCYIRKEGFDRAVETRITPFLDQLSFLLLSGVLDTIHVQMFYSLLRQKVNAALDAIVLPRDGERWLLMHDEDSENGVRRLQGYHALPPEKDQPPCCCGR